MPDLEPDLVLHYLVDELTAQKLQGMSPRAALQENLRAISPKSIHLTQAWPPFVPLLSL
jgi:hypothetical protein